MPQIARMHMLATVLLGAMLVLGTAGAAQPRAASPVQPLPVAAAAAIADVPDDLDLIVVVEHASELRSERIGEAVGAYLRDSGAGTLSKAWSGLATQLGWSETESLDRLLGRRVVLVSKSIGGDRRWALLSDVTVETEGRLKERLQAAPRAIDQGHQILSIENGEYELTSHHRAGSGVASANVPSKPGANTPAADRVTLVLGPAGKDELFDQMIGVLSGAAPQPGVGTMSGRDVFAAVCEAGPAEVLVLARLDSAPEGPPGKPGASGGVGPGGTGGGSAAASGAVRPDPWKDFVVLAGRHDPEADALLRDARGGKPQQDDSGAWRSRVVVRQTARRDALMKIEATPDAPFRALVSRGGGDVLLAMIQNAPLPDVLGAWAPFQELLSALPIPAEAKTQMSGQQVICLRVVSPDQRVSCTVARQTQDTERLARTLDPAIAKKVQSIEKQFGVEAPPPQDYAGVAPNAVRTTPLASSSESTLGVFSSRPLALSWVYPSRSVASRPVNADALADQIVGTSPGELGMEGDRGGGVGVGAAKPGWWAMNIAQTIAPPAASSVPAAGAAAPAAPAPRASSPSELLRADANALLTAPAHAPVARWVWLALAKPAALEQILPAAVPDFNGFRSVLRRFERVNLELQITEQGDIQGDLTVRLAPTH